MNNTTILSHLQRAARKPDDHQYFAMLRAYEALPEEERQGVDALVLTVAEAVGQRRGMRGSGNGFGIVMAFELVGRLAQFAARPQRFMKDG